ncbi:HAD-IIA family hydrolase [Bifidobacterium sp. ESL0763]|uniref:HAD-IIA family hydrolase n=1 Tax=Bifidobacterium sp. ESL0763 TaxID=2983227 RepID=UPI0023F8FF53|nr:HAD-IIA family hydrolase [Bifidobacterium sp. ESL0763]MDF7663736.1 HAD-IIA family hydrolase [Bifidobacterium sp. ESL0763]
MLKGTPRPLSETYGLALLDLDGVVYRGKLPVDHAADSIRDAEAAGMTMEYTTNNSSREQATVADQLKSFGLQVEPHQVITSSIVAARMVAHDFPAGSKVIMSGARHLREQLEGQGLTVVESVEDGPVAAVQGWRPEITWNEIANIAFAVERGARHYVTNIDLTIPRELGIAPGAGSMVQAVVNATGAEPHASAGKPESAMYDEARVLAAGDGERMVAKERCLAIGDRLDTDVEAGNRGGYDSLVVLTGVATPSMIMRAPAHLRPTYVAADLRDLAEAMPQPQRVSEREWSCAGASAILDGGNLSVSDASDINALRAACSLMWERTDTDPDFDATAIALPEFKLGR